MKLYKNIIPVCLVICVTLLMSFSTKGVKWDLLGTRVVNWSLDHDAIVVSGWEGKFDAVKVKVLRGALNMHRMVVHFRNGGIQEIELRNNFKAGSQSRVVDLTGDDRVITKVDFWYDTKNHSKKSVVELWGKH